MTYPNRDSQDFLLIGNTKKRSYEDCLEGGYISTGKLPEEERWMIYPWMKMNAVEFRIFRADMWAYYWVQQKDPYGSITTWEGTRAGYTWGPQDGTIRETRIGLGEMTESAEALYRQPYVTYLYRHAMDWARSCTNRHEAEDERAEQSQERRTENLKRQQEMWSAIHDRRRETKIYKTNASTSIVNGMRGQYLFSYETLVAVFLPDESMAYISIANRDGVKYGVTTMKAINQFVGGNGDWKNGAKMGRVLILPQAELEAML